MRQLGQRPQKRSPASAGSAPLPVRGTAVAESPVEPKEPVEVSVEKPAKVDREVVGTPVEEVAVVAKASPVQEPPQRKSEPRRETSPPSSISRRDYIAPESGGPVRDLSARRSGPGDSGAKGAADKKKRPAREPIINIGTRIPKGATPPPPPASKEPAPMRPDVRLTPDMIAGSRKGMNAPLENFVKQETAKAQAKSGAGALTEFKANADKAKGKGPKRGVQTEELDERGNKAASLSDMRRERKGRANRIISIEDADDDTPRHKLKPKKKPAGTISRKKR